MSRPQNRVLFVKTMTRALRALALCQRYRLGFYLEPIAPDGPALVHIASRIGAERAHRYGGAPIYTFP
jgi:hypothetical protein